MLLRHTPKEVVERSALTINPAKTCQPVGAMYAALGIHKCLPHSHGSQGCCAYHRSALTRHYAEPIMASTSSFTEGASVFGGQSNMLESINNIFALYDPDIIAVNTTCLSEVIGDDLNQIINRAIADNKIPKGKTVMYASTPSFKGSHVTGYANMLTAMVQNFATNTGKKNKSITLLPSFVEPSDMSEIKHIAAEMGIDYIMYPDTSGVVNAPMDGKFHMYPKGGTPREKIIASGDSRYALALGRVGTFQAAQLLDSKCKVKTEILDLPIGISATDAFIDKLRTTSGVTVPESITVERGQLVDVLCDKAQYVYGKKISLMGDPDILFGLVQFCKDAGMEVIHVITGTPAGAKWDRRIKELAGPNAIVKSGAQADLFYFHQLLQNTKPDLIFGNTYCKYIARDMDIPLIRTGFPIYDRIGHSYFPITGYRGGLHLLVKILDVFMDRQDRDASEEKFELVM
ncbi:nitrogenase molybdenum-iron protein subunit beta [Leadbettera azotonutricia]|uniref:Nitrogenase molybdenum-iron protein beta chain n=1 Tax=Leadbettera azotonutricia (strain ATCC BAA-888 / DSM 13862 / ZAS-9) TaxID=545695 RepID=F5Y9Q2_LEAAZ|nr:nitrogenase molybdenum-iron protein subunit beta [Leadbettera azotonutricia]AEF82504.1 nitrogenase molybdenum-iron protein beta chain [Leadbettera azotonutricia ZAS-9]